jgi:hypothetical protein
MPRLLQEWVDELARILVEAGIQRTRQRVNAAANLLNGNPELGGER